MALRPRRSCFLFFYIFFFLTRVFKNAFSCPQVWQGKSLRMSLVKQAEEEVIVTVNTNKQGHELPKKCVSKEDLE